MFKRTKYLSRNNLFLTSGLRANPRFRQSVMRSKSAGERCFANSSSPLVFVTIAYSQTTKKSVNRNQKSVKADLRGHCMLLAGTVRLTSASIGIHLDEIHIKAQDSHFLVSSIHTALNLRFTFLQKLRFIFPQAPDSYYFTSQISISLCFRITFLSN